MIQTISKVKRAAGAALIAVTKYADKYKIISSASFCL
jgi:hypothetical protein